ncbi:MAG: DNA alkylation repair protein [Oscillospiraceae bacterium]|nr:DNA alkylation repair protein [Oscillospiraceae bacterium]
MTAKEIKQRLHELQDKKYRDFQRRLIPNIPPESIIGVRTPELRKLAKEIGADSGFLDALPHENFEENQLHAFIISGMRDFGECVSRLEKFLPYVDNWATCDQMTVKLFRKHTAELLPYIGRWLNSGRTYTVRFGIGCLMNFYLDSEFREEQPEMVAGVDCGEYYVSMMVAWYFATALAKQYDAVIPYIEERRLDPETHRRTIQKSVESFRISDERKQYLRTLK